MWNSNAIRQLQQDQRVQVRLRPHSMSGRINWVTLAPINAQRLQVGDVVLARVQGKKREPVVLHEILEIREERFLIGGRTDGWVCGDAILGLALESAS